MNQPSVTPHGYPTQVEPLVSHRITIEPSLWDFAKEVGRGNASAGFRHILRQAKALREQATSSGTR